MRIEVFVKYARPIKKQDEEESDEEKAYKEAQRIITGKDPEDDHAKNLLELFSDKNLEYFYKPYVINTKDVHDFYPYDEQHVLVVTRFSGSLPVRMEWNIWKAFWEGVTGEVIMSADKAIQPVVKKKNNEKQL